MLRATALLSYDSLMALVAVYAAFLLRFEGHIPEKMQAMVWYGVPYALICFTIFLFFGRMHRRMWRYTSARDLMMLALSVMVALLFTTTLLFIITRLDGFPRSVLVITFVFHMMFCLFPRAAMRAWNDGPYRYSRANRRAVNALIIGVNNTTDLFIREITRQNPRSYALRGILDDDKAKRLRMVQGICVLGPTAVLPQILENMKKRKRTIQVLILADKRFTQRKDILEVARSRGIEVKRIPSMSDLEEGEQLTNLKPVLLEDLLQRNPVSLDMSALDDLIRHKRVLVTGAGGSIGAEVCRQVAARVPAVLSQIDHSELALYSIDRELAANFPSLTRRTTLLDIKDRSALDTYLSQFPADIIIHAAAYKHVPLVEANPISGLENNLIGTMNVADAAAASGVKTVVMISTDKAVNPTNVMGATKRAAEIYCQNHPSKTRFVTVRFGNVLGSTGSVVPLFQEQIRHGGPITLTHKEMTRYFMTIPEAVQLVLQAATLCKEDNNNPIYMLNMGEPVKIYDMATTLIRLSGLEPHRDIEIVEVGLRPGEKLFEELSYDSETMTTTGNEDIFYVKPYPLDKNSIRAHIQTIQEACASGDSMAAVRALKHMVSEYAPASNSPYALLNKEGIPHDTAHA